MFFVNDGLVEILSLLTLQWYMAVYYRIFTNERQMPLRLSPQRGHTMPTLGQLEMLWDAPELVRLLGSYQRVEKEGGKGRSYA